MGGLREIIEQYWGYSSYRPLQEEAMESVLAGRDSLVIMPTGGGKSICFQAPAIKLEGMAIVVSPLISLMKDQVDSLRADGVGAAFLNSSLTAAGQRRVEEQVNGGGIKLLYVSPERLVQPFFVDWLRKLQISFIAIDEAHCISMWGHNFRPEYRALHDLKGQLPGVALHAYTATATEQVQGDICENLNLDDPKVLVGSFDRPNLHYTVARRQTGKGKLDQLCGVIDRHANESGIIYCISRKNVEQLSSKLNKLGYRSAPYHAGLSDLARLRNQEAFIKEEVEIIVATVAFGMGIDKSNVRFVIHAGMPKSLEHYQQESGRAGRDGLDADCCLFYSMGDFAIWRQLLGELADQAAEVALTKLQEMFRFCSSVSCRHREILSYFSEVYGRDNCGACDICKGEVEFIEEGLVMGQKILSCVVRMGQAFGGDYTAKVLTGSRSKRVTEYGHEDLSTYGILAQESPGNIRTWINNLIGQGFLSLLGQYNLLQVTARGWELLRGNEIPRLLQPPPEKDAASPARSRRDTRSWEGVDRGLFAELRALRRQLAQTKGVPPFIIFGDASLRDMARLKPTSLDEFLLVHGVGQKKRDDYGERFIGVISDYGDLERGQAEA